MKQANMIGHRSKKCRQCGKEFVFYSDEWAYRRDKKYFCSWGCMRAFDRERQLHDGRKANGRRIDTPTLTVNGETKSIKQWSEETGIPYNTLYMRMYHGEEGEEVMRKERTGGSFNQKG